MLLFFTNHIKKLFWFSVLGTDKREQVTKNCNDTEIVTHLLAEVQIFALILNKFSFWGCYFFLFLIVFYAAFAFRGLYFILHLKWSTLCLLHASQ